MNYKTILASLITVSLISWTIAIEPGNNAVKIVGQMRNVMWKGELFGSINLDTIGNKEHLYGLGPVEYLAGEILIIDGKSYKSTALTDTTMKVEETYNIKAPFFGYANIAKWTEQILPDSIQSIRQLELYLDQTTKSLPRPFLFRLTGVVKLASIHVVNLPPGSVVHSPDDAHKGQKTYQLASEQSEIVGFFSTQHQSIFTHHDTYLHMHLITADKQKMGHLDSAVFDKGSMKLYLPK